MNATSDWRSFWDSEHSIYVNARHKDVHYRDMAEQIAAFVPGPGARVLDYGCGDALHADRVAAVAAEVLLADSAPSVRAAMAARFSGNPRIKVIGCDLWSDDPGFAAATVKTGVTGLCGSGIIEALAELFLAGVIPGVLRPAAPPLPSQPAPILNAQAPADDSATPTDDPTNANAQEEAN